MKSRAVLCGMIIALAWCSAHAVNHYIETPAEQITLQDAKCKTGGQEAMLLEKRSNGLGGYGCWELREGKVFIRWTESIGPNGSVLKMDRVVRYDAPGSLLAAATSGPSGADKALIDKMEELNSTCRGGSGDNPATHDACKQRDATMSQIRQRGWCWGPPSASNAEKRWMRCERQAAGEPSQECKTLVQAWAFNSFLEECSYGKGTARALGAKAKGHCEGLAEATRTAWTSEVAKSVQTDIERLGKTEFCRKNRSGYEALLHK